MLGQLNRYSFGNDRKSKVTHNFFVDDLKWFASNEIDINEIAIRSSNHILSRYLYGLWYR